MEIIFQRLVARNFLAIADSITWELNRQGLVAILGVNEDSAVADSNGSGKSSIYEALIWGLWGKTVRGLTSDAVINRKVGRDCCAQVEFTYNDTEFLVCRYRKDSKFKNDLHLFSRPIASSEMINLSGQTMADTQAKIDEILGIDYETFIRGPMMPQGSFKRFSQMSDAEAKSILESVLQVDVLAKAQAEALTRIAQTNVKLELATRELQTQKDRLLSVEVNLAKYTEQHELFNQSREEKIRKLNEEKYALEAQKNQLLQSMCQPSVIKANLEKAKAAQDKVKQLSDRLIAQWDETWTKDQIAVNECQSQITLLNSQAREVTERKDKISKLGQGKCPVCEQPINAKHRKQVLVELEKQSDKLRSAEVETFKQLGQVQIALRESASQRQGVIQRVQDTREEAFAKVLRAEQAVEEAKRQQKEILDLENRIENLQQAIFLTAQEDSPFASLVEGVKVELEQIRSRIHQLRPKQAAHARELSHLEFWKKGFSHHGLKAFILRSVTPFMNQRAEQYAACLTGGEIKVEFTTEATLKSGQTKEQFGVLVTNRNGADTYEGNSGGEKSRADLVINLVLADLVCSRVQKSFPQRFYDEPFENLDESGVEAVMSLLQDMVGSAGSIFVVTHSSQMQGQFNKILRVVKRNGRSAFGV